MSTVDYFCDKLFEVFKLSRVVQLTSKHIIRSSLKEQNYSRLELSFYWLSLIWQFVEQVIKMEAFVVIVIGLYLRLQGWEISNVELQ